jgi:hypothetical protein
MTHQIAEFLHAQYNIKQNVIQIPLHQKHLLKIIL